MTRLFEHQAPEWVGGRALLRKAVRLPVPSRHSERLTLPEAPVLHWQHSVEARPPTEISVSVTLIDGDSEHLLYEASLAARPKSEHRWFDGRLDLAAWAERDVELVFAADYTRSRDREARNKRTRPSAAVHWATPFLASEVERDPQPLSVLLVVVDSLRADRLGAYGAARPSTPNIDTLAARGALFENAFSQTNWTLPSMASIVSGLYPSHHGVTETKRRLAPAETHLPRLLARNGFLTAGFHAGGFVDPRYGFADGYDRYQRLDDLADLGPVVRWLESHRHHPFFLFLHTYDVHAPYTTVPEEYWRLYADDSTEALGEFLDAKPATLPPEELTAERLAAFSDLYDGEIRYVDDRLGALFEVLDRLDLADGTLVVFTSDHGEEFGDHGFVEHRTGNLHQELTRVPLILAGPGVSPGRRVTTPVELVDLLPTLAELLDLDGLESEALDGASFVPLLAAGEGRGDSARGERLAWSEFDQLRSVRTRRWTLILDAAGAVRLYDRESDPAETLDVATKHPEITARLLEQLRRRREATRGERRTDPVEIDDELLEQLRALGYVE
ncbi:MAG: sulfatase [Thermoanaerobaculia bacterium]|nr:sulfatase [Thermoanaerobaculia bacterium]